MEPEIEELVSQGMAIVGCSCRIASTWMDWASIVSKIQSFSEDLDTSEVPFDAIRPRILGKLTERYDRETADRLSREFADLYSAIIASNPAIVGHG